MKITKPSPGPSLQPPRMIKARSVSCSSFSPVIASYRNSSSPILVRCVRNTEQDGKSCCASSSTHLLAYIVISFADDVGPVVMTSLRQAYE